MTTEPVDVALVRMPYGELGQPSLALGLLKAVCENAGVSARAVPANLWFAEEMGPAFHDIVFEAYSTSLVGEWTFAGALFPDFHPDDDAYLRKVIAFFRMDSRQQWRHLHERFPYLDTVALLREVRRRAPAFVERVADRVLELEPRIVGCSSTFQQHCASLSLLRAIKQRRPDIITMIGGANCEGAMGRVAFEQFPWLDFVVSGEADGFFAPMCARLLEGGVNAIPPHELPEGVWGPSHRSKRAATQFISLQPVDGAPIARLEDMNESPVPNYDDYFAYMREVPEFAEWIRAALPFQTARGCWWGEKHHCTFCGISKTAMKFRAKTGDNVIEQMIALRDRYGIANFQGTEYIFDYRYFTTLLPRMKAEIGGYFRFEVKANLKPEQLQAFVDAGVLEVQPGVESLSDQVLTLLKKGVAAYQNILLLKNARKAGLLVYWNMLHTVPGDRDEWYGEMADLLPLVMHLQAPFGFAQIHYDRFSPYWRDPAQHGLELLPAYGYEHVYPFPRAVLEDLAYFFETPRQRNRFYKLEVEANAGLMRLTRVVLAWRDAWLSNGQVPTLTTTDLGDRLAFEDTRAVASARAFEIAGLERRVYLAAESGIVPAHLIATLQAEDPLAFSEAETRAAVQRLLDRKVVVLLSGRLLSLAIATPVAPFLAQYAGASRKEMQPSWARLMADKALDERRPSIALSCLRQPADEPLSDWLAPSRPLVRAGAR